jgi:hypothetical protein
MSQTKAQLISDLVQALNFTGTASAPANGAFLSATNTLALATNSAQRLTIDSSGNVGIGTTSPSDHLTVSHSANTAAGISITNTNNSQASAMAQLLIAGGDNSKGRLKIETNGAFHTIDEDSNGNLILEDNGTERMRIDSSGRLLLGTTTEGATNADEFTLATSGHTGITIRSGTTHQSAIYMSDATSGDGEYAGYVLYDHNVDALRFGANTSDRMRIDSSGRLLLGASTSAIVGGGGASLYQIETTSQNAISCVSHRGTGNASGSIFILGKSRGTSAGAVTSVGINDELGSLRFAGADDTDLQSRGGEISCEVDGTPGSNDMPGRLLFKTTADGSAAPTERMRIDSSGNVGIGTTSPSSLLTLNHATNPSIRFEDSGTKVVQINAEGSSTNFGSFEGKALVFATSTGSAFSERMRIDTAGHVLVNCTSLPSNTTQGAGFERKSSQTTLFISAGATSSATNLAEFFNTNGQVGRIVVTGSATSYHTSSDYRLKENATAISDGITRLKTLKPYRFNFKADADTTVDGFFAHEVTAVPEAISGTKDEVDSDNNPVYQGIDQSKLVPLLVAAVQELITKVETLEAA